jgi:hypothetical protein
MKPRDPVLLIALLALPVVAGGDRVHSGPVTPSPAHYDTNAPAFAAGQILNLDPTGKFTSAQHASDVQTILGEAASQSQEGLVEEKSPVNGGGIMVNLQGRFQNAMTMSIDANGNTSAPCVPATSAPAKNTGKVK